MRTTTRQITEIQIPDRFKYIARDENGYIALCSEPMSIRSIGCEAWFPQSDSSETDFDTIPPGFYEFLPEESDWKKTQRQLSPYTLVSSDKTKKVEPLTQNNGTFMVCPHCKRQTVSNKEYICDSCRLDPFATYPVTTCKSCGKITVLLDNYGCFNCGRNPEREIILIPDDANLLNTPRIVHMYATKKYWCNEWFGDGFSRKHLCRFPKRHKGHHEHHEFHDFNFDHRKKDLSNTLIQMRDWCVSCHSYDTLDVKELPEEEQSHKMDEYFEVTCRNCGIKFRR